MDRADSFYLFVSLGLVGCVNLFFLFIFCSWCFCILLCFSRSLRLSVTCLSVLVFVLLWRCLCLFLLVSCLSALSAFLTVVLCLFASLLDVVVLCCVFLGDSTHVSLFLNLLVSPGLVVSCFVGLGVRCLVAYMFMLLVI